MLAEIFMVRMEATARLSGETAPASNSRFLPFNPAGPLELTKGATNPDANALVKTAH
jgi:hypothetical protein